jgi:hypothetical protein
MYIDRKYAIEEAALQGKNAECEPSGNVIIQRLSGDQGVAIASDGYILAVVPVTLEDSDALGPFPAAYVKQARRHKNGRDDLRLILAEQTVGFESGAILHHGWASAAADYDWRSLIPEHPKEARCASLDPAQLTRLAAALGGGPVHLCIGAEWEEILVLARHDQDPYAPPVGVIMPVPDEEVRSEG